MSSWGEDDGGIPAKTGTVSIDNLEQADLRREQCPVN